MHASFTAALGAVAALVTSTGAGAASIEFKDAVARVTVIPEARSDVAVSIVKNDAHHPLQVSTGPDGRTIVDGGYRNGLFGGISGCSSFGGRPVVHVRGVGVIGYDDMAQVVVRVPMDAHVAGGGAVYGTVGRSSSVDLSTAGCGDWTVADVGGRFDLSSAGSGDVHAGSAGLIRVSTSGSGDIFTRAVSGGVEASIAGSSDIRIASVSGPVKVRISGSGDLNIDGGHASDLSASIAGSGDVNFKGVADTLSASIAGSGDVNVDRVTGAVKKSVVGSGDVNVGR
jgi:hypothetical protein